jgi:hypothetical protein
MELEDIIASTIDEMHEMHVRGRNNNQIEKVGNS